MEIICIEEKAFYTLLERVITCVEARLEKKCNSKWIDSEEAMKLLKIKSVTTLQRLRDEGKIKFSQPERKHIVYDRSSIFSYFEKHSREPFS